MTQTESSENLVFKIKNMISKRCINAVEKIFLSHHFDIDSIALGIVIVNNEPAGFSVLKLEEDLKSNGFKILKGKEEEIIERVKIELVKLIVHSDEIPKIRFSDYLSRQLGLSYSVLSKAFSSKEKLTIEKYVIQLKIERSKELITYGELTIKEIAQKLGYSSLQHLSNQFKNVTGISPVAYKNRKVHERVPFEEIGM